MHDYDIVCLSHLPWEFVFQRPQHLMTRFARGRRVLFFEEPRPSDGPACASVRHHGGVAAVTPHLPDQLDRRALEATLTQLLDSVIEEQEIGPFALWYYTPMALGFSRHLEPLATVFDCMDELSAFALARPELVHRERELVRRADLVFTGGRSLYEAKRGLRADVHLFPSSVDRAHFAAARDGLPEPADQARIPGPRIGYFGVIDERLDLELLAGLADARPETQIVMVGPILKIHWCDLPQRPNLHYLGMRSYDELPAYLAGWDVALMPFALNEATRFISPTKTLEYLAAGRPVVSTAVHDVVHPYGDAGIVRIAAGAEAFAAAVDDALSDAVDPEWVSRVEELLEQTSWDATWQQMEALLDGAVAGREVPTLVADGDAA